MLRILKKKFKNLKVNMMFKRSSYFVLNIEKCMKIFENEITMVKFQKLFSLLNLSLYLIIDISLMHCFNRNIVLSH